MTSISSSLGLLSGYDSSGSDEEDVEERTTCESVPNKVESAPPCSPLPSPRLPNPLLKLRASTSSGSVFSNPFHEEQKAKFCVLEKHVKLSDSNWATSGQGACLAYQRDGRCRYGTKCKYRHGSDLQKAGAEGTQQEELGRGEEVTEEKEEGKRKGTSQTVKRKKPGLSNTLIPPKKSLKNYQEQLANDRPWAL